MKDRQFATAGLDEPALPRRAVGRGHEFDPTLFRHAGS